MAEANSWKLDCNTDEDPLTSTVREPLEDGVEVYQVEQGGYETAPNGGPAVVQYDNDSETVNTETSSPEHSAVSTASSAPTAEMPSESQGGTSSARPDAVTWSRQDKGLFLCNLCSYSSKRASSIARHTRIHTGKQQFSCDLSPQRLTQRDIMVVHRQSHTGERPYMCSICLATFKSGSNLNSHMRIHNEERPYKCATYTDEGPLPSFLMAFGSGKGFVEWQVLQGGLETTREGAPVEVQCNKDSCSETGNTETSSTETSATPMWSTAPITEIPGHSQDGTSSASPSPITWSREDNGLLVCHLCSYSTKVVTNQRRHSRTHTGERPFSCDLCRQSFTRRDTLEDHWSTHTSERQYVCTICQVTYKHKSNLRHHMRTHRTEGPWICETCNSQFSDEASWSRHVVQHMKWGHA